VTHTVYHITGPGCGNGYVGCTSLPLQNRWWVHHLKAPGRTITPLRTTDDAEVAADLEALYIILKDTLHPAGRNHTRSGKARATADEMSEDYRARKTETMRKQNYDPEFKAVRVEGLSKYNSDPESKAAQSERARETMRRLRADPEFKAKLDSPEARAKKSAASTAYWERKRKET
jgi:hypothetical protein